MMGMLDADVVVVVVSLLSGLLASTTYHITYSNIIYRRITEAQRKPAPRIFDCQVCQYHGLCGEGLNRYVFYDPAPSFPFHMSFHVARRVGIMYAAFASLFYH